MIKPDWNTAPWWAQWLAMDSCGKWYWYEFEPDRMSDGFDNSNHGGIMANASSKSIDWKYSLEGRP